MSRECHAHALIICDHSCEGCFFFCNYVNVCDGYCCVMRHIQSGKLAKPIDCNLASVALDAHRDAPHRLRALKSNQWLSLSKRNTAACTAAFAFAWRLWRESASLTPCKVSVREMCAVISSVRYCITRLQRERGRWVRCYSLFFSIFSPCVLK